MKTYILRKWMRSLNATLLASFLSLLFASSAFSLTIVFQDNFDGYADDAALTVVWPRVSGTSSSIFLANDPINPANLSIEQTTAAGRLRHEISGGIVTTVAEPVIIFSFDLYDTNGGTSNGRVYGELRNSASPTGLLAAGIYNSVNVGTFDTSRYQARAISGGGWIQLDAPRSVGWHNFRFEIIGNSADLYVDNVLDPHFTDQIAGGVVYDWINIGSGLTGNTAAYFDNVFVATNSEFSGNVPVNVMIQGLGSGTVHSTAPDMNCTGGTCTKTYPSMNTSTPLPQLSGAFDLSRLVGRLHQRFWRLHTDHGSGALSSGHLRPQPR